MATSATSGNRDANRNLALIVENVLGTDILYPTGLSLTNAVPMHVAVVDGQGTQITSFGGGTQYAENATTSPATGTVALGRYLSSLPTLTTAELHAPMLDSSAITMMNMAYKLDSTNDAIAIGNAGTLAAVKAASTAAVATDAALVVAISPNNTVDVTGTFWQTTQPVSLASVPSHAVTNAGTFAVQPTAAASGGYTPGKLISAASTNATSVKASAGTLGYITASNINASPRYLKIYNKASAPTVGTDTPVHVFLIPGNTSGAGTNIPLPPQGIALGTGIAIAITTGVADTDTGAVAANDIVINYGYN